MSKQRVESKILDWHQARQKAFGPDNQSIPIADRASGTALEEIFTLLLNDNVDRMSVLVNLPAIVKCCVPKKYHKKDKLRAWQMLATKDVVKAFNTYYPPTQNEELVFTLDILSRVSTEAAAEYKERWDKKKKERTVQAIAPRIEKEPKDGVFVPISVPVDISHIPPEKQYLDETIDEEIMSEIIPVEDLW